MKQPANYTIAEIREMAERHFPPPWGVLEWLDKLEAYVANKNSAQKPTHQPTPVHHPEDK